MTNCRMSLVLGSCLLLSGLSVRADESETATVASFKAFVPKFIDAFKVKERELAGVVFDTEYDFKKTASVLHPLVGTLSFSSSKEDGPSAHRTYFKWKFAFHLENGKSALAKAEDALHSPLMDDDQFFEMTADLKSLAEDAQT